MKEIVFISGKGGTGKTSLASSFAFLAGRSAVIADCDVDAANMHLLLQAEETIKEDFYSGELAVIDNNICDQCGLCQDVCRFNAIEFVNDAYTINETSCEGCGYCSRVCSTGAITNHTRKAGQWYISSIKSGSTMVHAKLDIGADNSGKLVAKVKKETREIAGRDNIDLILVDGPPGIGCPVVSSLSGANLAVIVIEPSLSGFHDLKRVHELIKGFNIPAACIINKSDINKDITEEIVKYLKQENIIYLSDLPYDEDFSHSMTSGKTIIEYSHNGLSLKINEIWQNILTNI